MANIPVQNHQSDVHVEVARPEELQELHAQLEKLVTHHQAALQEVEGLKDAERIITWIERCEEGSAIAERKLYHEGLEMLEKINTSLHLAMEEQQRIEEESPSVASDVNLRGREAERYAKASGRANEVVSTLEHLADPTTKPDPTKSNH